MRCRGRTRYALEEGTTLTELMVAIGVFSVLMILVGSGMTAVFRGIADTRALSSTEQEQRNAMLWISRALRYVDGVDAPNQQAAVLAASTNSFTFNTYAGLGDVRDVPYRVTIERNAAGQVVAVITGATPEGVIEESTYVLMTPEPRTAPAIAFEYLCSTSAGSVETPCDVTDDTSVWGPSLRKVTVMLTDDSSGIATEQTIVLVNRI
jgi:Tfp pilus assembly protein PilW